VADDDEQQTTTSEPPAWITEMLSGLAFASSEATLTPAQRAETNIANQQAAAARTPIGVDPWYTASYRGGADPRFRTGDNTVPWSPDDTTGMVQIGPGYYQGAELMFASADPGTVWGLQQQMITAGLIGRSTQFSKGIWDDATANAFGGVLAYANRTGLTWEAALANYVSNPITDSTGGPKGPVFTARLSNPDDIRAAFRRTTKSLLGGVFVDDTQQEAFVNSFQEAEVKAQRAAFNAATGGGGTVVEAPSLEVLADETLKETDPAGYRAARFAGYGRMIQEMIGS
jgi:hypothetical protein